jgi:hypothetical protein
MTLSFEHPLTRFKRTARYITSTELTRIAAPLAHLIDLSLYHKWGRYRYFVVRMHWEKKRERKKTPVYRKVLEVPAEAARRRPASASAVTRS